VQLNSLVKEISSKKAYVPKPVPEPTPKPKTIGKERALSNCPE
jgi:hypothetical protein